jgi:signal transduction histidine kinase
LANDPPHVPPALEPGDLLGLDREEIRERLAFFAIAPEDEARLARTRAICNHRLDDIIADFYAHLLRFPPLEQMLRAEPGRVARLQELQKTYFRQLTRGRIDSDYVASRLRVGNAHQRIGLRPEWYIGGFGLLLRLCLHAIYQEHGQSGLLPEAEAIIKAVFLDMSLVLDTYIEGGFVDRESADRMREATAIAEEALRVKQETERLKDDLTSMAVHDLKNPVNGIAMTVQLALRKSDGLSDAQVGYLQQIGRTCSEMMRLIQNLLEIAKIEEGKMPVELETIRVLEVVSEVHREYAPVAAQTGRRLVLGVGNDLPEVTADRSLLRRVLVNLVANALRHSGSPEVAIEVAAGSEPDTLIVRVTDHGRGFGADQLARVFEKFRSVRRSPTSAPASDTGLGLPFCKLAVELMGGEIGVTSVPGEQTCFWVILRRGS